MISKIGIGTGTGTGTGILTGVDDNIHTTYRYTCENAYNIDGLE